MEGNFFVVIIAVWLIRKYLQTKTTLPQWDKYLLPLQRYSVFLFLANAIWRDKQYWTFESLWDLVLFFLVYFLYLHRSNRIARILMIAGIPLVSVLLAGDFLEFWTPHFYQKIRSYFGNAVSFGSLWLLAFGFGAANQHKALLKEQKKREAEEEQNKIVVNELESKVAERTAEITRQKDELEKTLSELRTTQAQLIQSEKLASLGELTAGIAHEIQNPLNFVNNFSELSVELLQELSDEIKAPIGGLGAELLADITQNLEKISLHGKRASSIVKGMLEHSRASTGVKELTDINALADEYLRLSYHGLRAKDKHGSTTRFNADFKVNFDEAMPKISVIPQDFGRVLLNIINNGFYAVQQKAKLGIEDYKPLVTVNTTMIENEIQIKIADNGAGMPESVKAKIFQPFFTTKPTGQGTGLGLSLAYDIVTKGHGGTIEVESVEGVGTTFTVKLSFNN